MSDEKISDILLDEIRLNRKAIEDLRENQTGLKVEQAKTSSLFGSLSGSITAIITVLITKFFH